MMRTPPRPVDIAAVFPEWPAGNAQPCGCIRGAADRAHGTVRSVARSCGQPPSRAPL
jgi:hypothetical protein